MSRIIEVNPLYGWGWADSDERPWDHVPDPFHAEVDPRIEVWFDKPVRTLQGVVKEPQHEMDGFSVLLSERHDPWDGDVNVTLTSATGREVRGFGSIDVASFDG